MLVDVWKWGIPCYTPMKISTTGSQKWYWASDCWLVPCWPYRFPATAQAMAKGCSHMQYLNKHIYIYIQWYIYIYIHIQWYICIYIYIIYIYDWIILNRCWHSWREKHEKNEKNWTNWENTCRDHSAMALLSSLFFRAKFLQSFTNSMSFWWCVAIFALHWCASTKSAKFGMPCR